MPKVNKLPLGLSWLGFEVHSKGKCFSSVSGMVDARSKWTDDPITTRCLQSMSCSILQWQAKGQHSPVTFYSKFIKQNGICHVVTACLYSPSSCSAEQAVPTVKEMKENGPQNMFVLFSAPSHHRWPWVAWGCTNPEGSSAIYYQEVFYYFVLRLSLLV